MVLEAFIFIIHYKQQLRGLTAFMKIGWVRHGRTAWNALGKIQGQTDIPLNEEGKQQAERLALRLAANEIEWDAVISSDLMRARETARTIAEKLGVPLLPPDHRLRERFFGEIEGTTEEERLARWGEDWRTTFEGQETDAAVFARGMSFIKEWREQKPGQRLLVVTHGSFLNQMLHSLCEGLDGSYIGNMSYSITEFRNEQWTSLLHNCTVHLNN